MWEDNQPATSPQSFPNSGILGIPLMPPSTWLVGIAGVTEVTAEPPFTASPASNQNQPVFEEKNTRNIMGTTKNLERWSQLFGRKSVTTPNFYGPPESRWVGLVLPDHPPSPGFRGAVAPRSCAAWPSNQFWTEKLLMKRLYKYSWSSIDGLIWFMVNWFFTKNTSYIYIYNHLRSDLNSPIFHIPLVWNQSRSVTSWVPRLATCA